MRPTTFARLARRAPAPRAAALAACLLALAGCGEYEDPRALPATEAPAEDDAGAAAARPFAPVSEDGRGPAAADLAGLYDGSIARPLGRDVRYVLITPEATLVVYDYAQDPYGTGANCFVVGPALPLVHRGGDDYLLGGRAVRLARETLGIGFGSPDALDEDGDGDFTEFVYRRFPRVTGLAAADLNACA